MTVEYFSIRDLFRVVALQAGLAETTDALLADTDSAAEDGSGLLFGSLCSGRLGELVVPVSLTVEDEASGTTFCAPLLEEAGAEVESGATGGAASGVEAVDEAGGAVAAISCS